MFMWVFSLFGVNLVQVLRFYVTTPLIFSYLGHLFVYLFTIDLGHCNIATTGNVYSYIFEKYETKITETIEQYLV